MFRTDFTLQNPEAKYMAVDVAPIGWGAAGAGERGALELEGPRGLLMILNTCAFPSQLRSP